MIVLLLLFGCLCPAAAWLVTARKWKPSTRLSVASPTSVPTKMTMGIPPHLEAMEVGASFEYELMTVEKVSSRPPIFVLRNALSKQECETVVNSVSRLQPARTLSGSREDVPVYRKSSFVCWLDNAEGTLIRTMANKAHSIFMPHQVFDVERGVESLQVVRYEEQGEYVLHHDSNARLLTVLYYLNGAGETWFPLADCDLGDVVLKNRNETLKHCQSKTPGSDGSGVLVSCEGRGTQVQQGDAVAFFSYFTDRTVDWKSIHAGMPARSTKWIANHWYHYFPYSFPSV